MLGKRPAAKRKVITRAALESTIAAAVRESHPGCAPLVEIIIERVVPKSSGEANWALKGVKYGKADRERCNAAISSLVEAGLREFEITDG